MTIEIDDILNFLATNHGTHQVKEISYALRISPNMCKEVLSLLIKYGFVLSNEKQVEISPVVKDFIHQTSEKNPETPLSPLIVSRQ